MDQFPPAAKDLKGNEENFSVSILVYSEDYPDHFEIGHYNFDTKAWSHFGDFSMKLICWCYAPDASEFVKKNDLTSVTHDGYRD